MSWIKRERQTFSTNVAFHLWAQVEKRTFQMGSFKRKDREFVEAHGFSLKGNWRPIKPLQFYLNTGDLPKEVLAIGENICVCEC